MELLAIGLALALAVGVVVLLRFWEKEPSPAPEPPPAAAPPPPAPQRPALVVVPPIAPAAALIEDAIREQLLYEVAHGRRQVERMQVVNEKLRPARPDAGYDHDQRVFAVRQRVVRACSLHGRAPPPDLEEQVEQALAEATNADA